MAHGSLIGAPLSPAHTRKPPNSSALGRVQQPPTRSFIQKGPKHSFIPMSPNPGNTHRPACNLGDFSGIIVHSGRVGYSVPGKTVTLTQAWDTRACPRRYFEHPPLASTPFDDQAGCPLRAMHYLSTGRHVTYQPSWRYCPSANPGSIKSRCVRCIQTASAMYASDR